MLSYELCKKLKRAGFPQKFTLGIFYAEKDAEFKHIAEYQKKLKFCDNADKFIDIPTLSELIEACGDKFISLIHPRISKKKLGMEEWLAQGTNFLANRFDFGKSPEEAVAQLYLKLHEK